MGCFFASGRGSGNSQGLNFLFSPNPFTGQIFMNAHLKSYAWFVAFLVVTKIVVKPVVTQLGIPLLSDAL